MAENFFMTKIIQNCIQFVFREFYEFSGNNVRSYCVDFKLFITQAYILQISQWPATAICEINLYI